VSLCVWAFEKTAWAVQHGAVHKVSDVGALVGPHLLRTRANPRVGRTGGRHSSAPTGLYRRKHASTTDYDYGWHGELGIGGI
jgi:hypothetical protein